MGLICRDFAIAYVLLVIAFIALAAGIEAVLGTDLGNAFNIIPQIVAALIAGQRHGKRTAKRPDSGFAWQVSFWMSLISLGLSLIPVIGFIVYMGPGDSALLLGLIQSEVMTFILVILLILFVYFLITRFFFGLGAKQGAASSPQADVEIFR